MVDHGVLRFVFSSSAGVYGEPPTAPIPEEAPIAPLNPYGESKAVVERLLPLVRQPVRPPLRLALAISTPPARRRGWERTTGRRLI